MLKSEAFLKCLLKNLKKLGEAMNIAPLARLDGGFETFSWKLTNI